MLSKLIQEIIDPILASITPNFIDRYGGLVETLEVKEVIDPANPSKTQIQKFPISCYVDQSECNDPESKYRDLVPDETKASILYFEELNPMRFEGLRSEVNRAYVNWQQWRGKARLVVWLNAGKLGIGEENNNYVCDWIFPFMDKLLRELSVEGKFTSGDMSGGIYKVQPTNLAPKNLTLFNKYTYNKYVNYYRYPYDYFGIDFDFTVNYCLGSNSQIQLGNEIACPFSQGQTPFVNEYSMLFDGVDKKIDLNGESFLSFTDGVDDLPYTISIWVYPVVTGGIMTLISKQGELSIDEEDEYILRINADNKVLFAQFSGLNSNLLSIISTTTVTPNAWNHIAATSDGSKTVAGQKLYINGNLVAVTSVLSGYTGMQTFPNSVMIGAKTLLSQAYKGNIDELRFYNRALSSAEIASIYNSGTPTSNNDISGLIAYNKMGDGATYDGTNWSLPDEVGTLSNATSQNMDLIDRTTNIP